MPQHLINDEQEEWVSELPQGGNFANDNFDLFVRASAKHPECVKIEPRGSGRYHTHTRLQPHIVNKGTHPDFFRMTILKDDLSAFWSTIAELREKQATSKETDHAE